MKKLLFTTLLISAITLSGCQKAKSETAIISLMSKAEDLHYVSAKTVEYMIKNDFNFNLLLYTENCSYCEMALESAREEQSRANIRIYALEMNKTSIDYLCDSLPSLFTRDDAYPEMRLFSEGKISYKIDYSPLQNYKSLHRVLFPQVYPSKLWAIYEEESFNSLLHEGTTALIYTYDSNSESNVKELTKKVIDYGYRSNDYFTIFIDKNAVKTGLISRFYQYTGFSDDGQFDYLFVLQNGQRKNIVRYLSADVNQIDYLLNSIL